MTKQNPPKRRTNLTRRPTSASATLLATFLVVGCGQQVTSSPAPNAAGPSPDMTNELSTTRQAVSSSATPASFNAAGGSLNGSYRGWGQVVRDFGGACLSSMPVYGMKVAGNQVHFGSFNGTIQPNGTIDMAYGGTSVIGRFEGPHFVGRWIAPACSYDLRLDREG